MKEEFGFYSVWWLLLSFAGLYALAALPVFAVAGTPSGSAANTTSRRLLSLDGLRGFLALSVFFHHAAIYHRYLRDGAWVTPPSTVFALLGPFGVSVFFLITGFLFWSQLLRAQGRPDWLRLYIGRVFRIGPLFLVASLTVLSIVAFHTGLHRYEPMFRLAKHLVRWLSIGILTVSDVNGYLHPGNLLADVTWTLRWEWLFYFSLPFLAFFTRGSRFRHLIFVLTALVLCQFALHLVPVLMREPLELVQLFPFGMLIGSLFHLGRLLKLPDRLASLLLLVAVVAYFNCSALPLVQQMLLAFALYLVICGCTCFGVLTSKSALRLGDISYGIYLLQGLALVAVFRIPALRAADLNSTRDHWLMSFCAAALLIGLATIAHRAVELPGISAGKRAIAALARRLHS